MSPLTSFHSGEPYYAELLARNRVRDAGAARDAALRDLLGPLPTGLTVLDAGCGLGGFSAPLLQGRRLVCADVNPHCLAEVRAGQRGEPVRVDLERPWPFADHSFDLVLLGDVLEHLFDTAHVLASARSALKPGGELAVAVPNVGYWRRRLRLLLKGELASEDSSHVRFFSPRSLERQARGHGFRLLGCRAYAWNCRRTGLPLAIAWGFVMHLRKIDGEPAPHVLQEDR